MTRFTTDTPATGTQPTSTQLPERFVQLDITGMMCASCAMRIDKRLNKLDGVSATVNYATEQAKGTVTDDVTTDKLVSAVEAVGYSAALPRSSSPSAAGETESAEVDSTAPLRQRLLMSTALAVPVILWR